MSSGSEVFISYSHKDERYREQLGAHLSQLRNEGLVSDWHDRKIPPGSEWAEEIDQHVESAQLILLLISPDFLASNYCYEIEMRRALERHAAGSARVIPVILRPADWTSAPFTKLQALPKDGRAITKWGNRDEAWLNVIKGVRRVIYERDEQAIQTPSIDANDTIDPDWRQKLDRIEQTGTARYLVGDMLKHGQPRCICFCWYGGTQDGVDPFHDRLEAEFDDVSAGRTWPVRPEWPAVISRRGFQEMLQCTLDGADDVGSAMRQQFRGRRDRRQLLYMNHTPVKSSQQLSPTQFLDYVRWWDEEVLDTLEPHQCVVLGVSFIVNNPVQFRYAMDTVAAIPAHPFSDRFVFKFLPVLAPLEPDDIRTFFRRIDVQRRVDPQLQERAIEKILNDTDGEYDLVVRELEVLLTDGFDIFSDLVISDAQNPDANDIGY